MSRTTALHEAEVPNTTDLYELSQWAFDTMTEAGYDVVLASVHGSHLYGTAHSDSDLDFYAVIAEGTNVNLKVGSLDVNVVNMKTWLNNAHSGSHQAVELMFSPYAVLGEKWAPFVRAQRPSALNFMKKSRSASQHLIERGDKKAHKRTWTFMRHAYSYYLHGDPFYRQYQNFIELKSPNR